MKKKRNHEVKIYGDHIKLSQFLKKINIIESGGKAKSFLEKHEVIVNGIKKTQRSSKVYVDSIVWIDSEVYKVIRKEPEILEEEIFSH